MPRIRSIQMGLLGLLAAYSAPAIASTIYSNDFQTPATAFNQLAAGGTLSSLSTASLPTDGGGISSPNQSTYLARLGLNVVKSTSTPEKVTLSLNGLTAGTVYTVAFDLFIGGSWDGSVGSPWGPDEWALFADSGANHTTLVNATFSNCGYPAGICGAGGPPTYSDATPTAGAHGTTYHPEMGADFYSDSNSNYALDYGIYYFSHGAGNPVLTFTAGASTASLTFERISLVTDSQDEYWGLDNILVTGQGSASPAPEPGSAVLIILGVAAVFAGRIRRRA